MTNELNYKGYKGSSEYSEEDGVWFGKILYIKDLIMYEAEEQEGLYDSFKQAVDEYFEDCKRRGCESDKPCSGTFNVRVGADMHLELALLAIRKRTSMNEVVKQACAAALQADKKTKEVSFGAGGSATWVSDGFRPEGVLCS